MNAAPMKALIPGRASRSLRLRLIRAGCAGFALCTAVLLTLFAHLHAKEIAAILSEHAKTTAASAATLVHGQVAANDRVGLASRLEAFNEMTTIRSLAITDRQGVPLAVVRRNAAGNMTAMPLNAIGPLGTPGVDGIRGPALFPDPEPGFVWSPIGKIAPIGWVRLEYETSRLTHTRNAWLAAGLLVLIGMTLAGAVLMYRLAALVSSSLAALVRAAQSLASAGPEETATHRARASLPHEFAEMSHALEDVAALVGALETNWMHNQAQYRQLLFALPEPIVEIDSELRILGANPAWQAMLPRSNSSSGAEIESIAAQLNGTELEHLTPGILALVRGTHETLHERIRISRSGASADAWFDLDAYRLLDQRGKFTSLLLHASPMKPP